MRGSPRRLTEASVQSLVAAAVDGGRRSYCSRRRCGRRGSALRGLPAPTASTGRRGSLRRSGRTGSEARGRRWPRKRRRTTAGALGQRGKERASTSEGKERGEETAGEATRGEGLGAPLSPRQLPPAPWRAASGASSCGHGGIDTQREQVRDGEVGCLGRLGPEQVSGPPHFPLFSVFSFYLTNREREGIRWASKSF
jgi:hypothetical protein